MSDYEEQIERLEVTADLLRDNLELSVDQTEEIRTKLALTAKEITTMERQVSRGIKSAFDGMLFEGRTLSDALKTVTQSVVNASYNAAMTPVTNQLGGLLTQGLGNLFPFANGGAFSQGRVVPFATGGVVSSPTYFPMQGGTGLMGEAGPEAIMPLARGADGRLGVRSAGGSTANIVMNVTTPDVQSFNRSRGQIAAQMSRALSRGNRNA
ncbi:phage tail tape measure protein [Aliishimia ponticola]|uniref:Phage tail tape measure protein n=1 Tax=Aliishimia ponticola TaxID=2499833 RepID=A0A4S4NFF5_9RHOB|nr:phage tail tape measure protein [Aliishimia ponticola]THH38314.1 phage tail tape measure protein [Aliishimia ponticola]